MAIINVALSDTFDQWRTKTNTLGTNQGDLASLDAGFAATDLVGALNELRSGEDLTQLILGDSTGVGNNRIKLGDSSDLQIFHDATNSAILNSTGELHIKGDLVELRSGDPSHGETYLKASVNGAVELYHDDIKKLETTTTGVNVTGEVDMDTLKMPDVTAGKILVADGTSYQEVTMSGDASIASNGSLTVATDAITSGKIQADAVGSSEIAASAVGASEIANNSITSTKFGGGVVTLQIKNSSGTVLKTLRSPGS